MKKLLLLLLCFFVPLNLYASTDENINKVFKLESYEYEEFTDTYYLTQYWSSIYVEDGLIYTNAHVVLDEDDEPIWNYRVCKTIDFKDKPECFSIWTLLYYDVQNDLAVLSISDPEVDIVTKSDKELWVWDSVKVYGYPSNWWNTITYTEWKISWYESGLYKIDANIDAWNSWWWVFDLDWNLIWIAVSVKIGYTTMWYIIPISEINDFKNKVNKNNINEYEELANTDFLNYHELLKNIVWKTTFSNSEIDIETFSKYWFKVDEYITDNDRIYFSLSLTDKKNETYIFVNNIKYYWIEDLDFDSVFSKEYELYEMEQNDLDDIKVSKMKKRVIWGKNTILYFVNWEDESVVLWLYIEISKNNYQQVFITSSSINNNSFLRWLALILKNIIYKDIDSENIIEDQFIVDSLEFELKENFYLKSSIGDVLFYWWDDIQIWWPSTGINERSYYSDDTMSSLLQSSYSRSKDYYYYNDFLIKETDSWDYYLYNFLLNNRDKYWWYDKNAKKYKIEVTFYDIKDDKEFYDNTITFEFDNINSKKIIDDFIEWISTVKWENPFSLWELKVWENLINRAEFKFED